MMKGGSRFSSLLALLDAVNHPTAMVQVNIVRQSRDDLCRHWYRFLDTSETMGWVNVGLFYP